MTDVTPRHLLVKRTHGLLRKQKPDRDGFIGPGLEGLDVWIGRDSVDRAVVVLDLLFARLEGEGWKIEVREHERKRRTLLRAEGEEFTITLREHIKQTPHRPTPDEKGKPDWMVPRFDRRPSGELHLVVESTSWFGVRCRWRDGRRRTLEACVDDAIARIREAAHEVRERRATREREERERREQEERAGRARERGEQRRREVQALVDEATRWRTSRLVRDYIAAVRDAAGGTDGEVGEWLTWAEGVAVELDPLPARSLSTTTREGGSGHEV